MSTLADLERRIAELEDQAAIRDLVYRYTENIHARREHDNARSLRHLHHDTCPNRIW